jgi:hypothetical protein
MATTLYKARLNDAKQQLMNSNVSEADVEELDVFEPMVEDLES